MPHPASKRRSPVATILIVVAVVLGNAARAEDPGPSMARFLKIRAPEQVSFAPYGPVFAIDWPDGINQLYMRPPRSPADAPMRRLTHFPDGIRTYTLGPGGRSIIVSAAGGGSEQNDLHHVSPATGAVTPLLVDPQVVYAFQHWLDDGSGFIYSANDESPSDFFLYRYDFRREAETDEIEGGDSTRLLARPGYWVAADATRDRQRLLVARYESASRASVYELSVESGELDALGLGEDSYDWPLFYLPGEREAAFISDGEGGIRRLFVRDLATGEVTCPLPDLDPYPMEEGVVNEHRTLAVLAYNEDGYRTPRLVQLPSFEEVPLPPIEKGYVGGLDVRGRYVTWSLSNARSPGITYFCKAGASSVANQLTVTDDQGIDLASFTLPRLVTYASFDGLEIPAFLSLPPDFVAGEPIPFIVNFHGGPEGQTRPWFSRSVQYFLSRGFGVLQPNVRGSTGYGRDFQMLDDERKRWDSVRDGVAAARWLVEREYARPGRIAAYGGSYGGFMAVAAVIEGADVFGACVDVVGIVNFQTFLEQTKDYRRKLREAEYGSLDDPELLASISPIHRIDDIKVPMLIAHGLNDPRVPVGEAMQLAVGLQKRGYDPELLFFPDEGHGFAKLENRLLFYERMAAFLEREIGH